ncbi:hypothetical protein RHGRI_019194 [Rhododendron griersonianum]|uniref:RNase H type-1 domain-containing protein n=1 Tax=Rhododendron griersonianum TaxID=479676 RepID=A0AAV6JH15_9ERIC|nr:hypothetical protein RHGRI_019194 [Rhododendron griersonianum]
MLEADSQSMVKIMRNKVSCPVQVEVIVEDIRREKGRFQWCGFQLVRQTANAVANNLASHGLRGVGTRTWESRALQCSSLTRLTTSLKLELELGLFANTSQALNEPSLANFLNKPF